MPIAVFDIDGTLTDTMSVDEECFEAAILEIVGIEVPSDWASFSEVTDAAILETACKVQGAPLPDMQTQELIAARVAELLVLQLEASPGRFRPIPGASEIFRELRESGWQVAMATGAWRPSAHVKLGGAGIPWEGVPLATSSDHRSRKEIIRLAVSAASGERAGPVVYFGDGPWDGRAATSLGCGFIGVGPVENEEVLRGAGAVGHIIDFSDPNQVLRQLELASV